jgi:voltage-gated potassium channel
MSLFLSVLVLIGLGVETLVRLPPSSIALLDRLDFFICLFFLYDFFHRLYRAPSKLQYLKWGWIDLVSSIPVSGFWQWGRIARIVRLLRVLRAFRSMRVIWSYTFRDRPAATLKAACLLAVLTLIFSSIAILNCEDQADCNIKTADDALWWSFTTMITVGSEKYPVTDAGRVIGALLMVVGVALTGVYTAYVASYFIGGAKNEQPEQTTMLLDEIRSLKAQLEKVFPDCRDAKENSKDG